MRQRACSDEAMAAFNTWYERMMRRPTLSGKALPYQLFSLLLYSILKPSEHRDLIWGELGGMAFEQGMLPDRWDELALAELEKMRAAGQQGVWGTPQGGMAG